MQAIVRLKRKFYFKAWRMRNHYVVGALLSWKAGFGVLLRPDVIVPTAIVAGLCMLAEFVVETAKLSDDLYSVDQSGPTKWMLERLAPGIDVGTEAHEILGLSLYQGRCRCSGDVCVLETGCLGPSSQP